MRDIDFPYYNYIELKRQFSIFYHWNYAVNTSQIN